MYTLNLALTHSSTLALLYLAPQSTSHYPNNQSTYYPPHSLEFPLPLSPSLPIEQIRLFTNHPIGECKCRLALQIRQLPGSSVPPVSPTLTQSPLSANHRVP